MVVVVVDRERGWGGGVKEEERGTVMGKLSLDTA